MAATRYRWLGFHTDDHEGDQYGLELFSTLQDAENALRARIRFARHVDLGTPIIDSHGQTRIERFNEAGPLSIIQLWKIEPSITQPELLDVEWTLLMRDAPNTWVVWMNDRGTIMLTKEEDWLIDYTRRKALLTPNEDEVLY